MLHLARAIVATSGSVRAGDTLFAADEILEIDIRAPVTKLMQQATGDSEFAGSLELAGGRSIPMSCSKYGISRLRECQLASLKISVEESHVLGTPFEGMQTLRLVTPCRLAGGFDKYILLEYLVYRSYAILAEPALGVRLVRVRFIQGDKHGARAGSVTHSSSKTSIMLPRATAGSGRTSRLNNSPI